jgi:hypothetical protein
MTTYLFGTKWEATCDLCGVTVKVLLTPTSEFPTEGVPCGCGVKFRGDFRETDWQLPGEQQSKQLVVGYYLESKTIVYLLSDGPGPKLSISDVLKPEVLPC